MSRSPDPQLRRWWQQLIESFDPERTTIAEFCRQHRISGTSFYQWRRKLRDQPLGHPAPPQGHRDDVPGFLKVQLRSPEVASDRQSLASFHFPGGIRLDVPADEHDLLVAAIGALVPNGDPEEFA